MTQNQRKTAVFTIHVCDVYRPVWIPWYNNYKLYWISQFVYKVAALLLHIKLRTWVFLEIQFCCCWKFLSEELKSMQEIKASLKNTSSAQKKQSSSCETHCRKLLCWFGLNFSKLLCFYCEAFLQTNISYRHLANTFLNFLWCYKKLIHSRLFITAIILWRNFSNLLVIPINHITLIYILGHSNCNWLWLVRERPRRGTHVSGGLAKARTCRPKQPIFKNMMWVIVFMGKI